MKFENAKKGVRKFILSESLFIIATLLAFGSEIVVLQSGTPDDFESLVMTSLGLFFAAGLMTLIGQIIQLIALNQARKDEPQFKTALQFVITGMITTAVSIFTAGTFSAIFSGIGAVANLLASVYIILGVYCVAYKLDYKKVQTSGKINMFIVAVLFTFVIFSRLIVIFMPVLSETLDLISYTLEFIGHLALIIYFSQTKVMFAEKTA